MAHDDPRFDVRVRARRLRDGRLSQDELDAFLTELPDEADAAVPCQTAMTRSAGRAEGGDED